MTSLKNIWKLVNSKLRLCGDAQVAVKSILSSISMADLNPLTLRAAKRGLMILEIFNLQTHFLENIWRRNVDHKSNKNSPSNILWIFALFKRYFQRYENSRRHFLEKLLSVNGLNGTILLHIEYRYQSLIRMLYKLVDIETYKHISDTLKSVLPLCQDGLQK